MALPIPESLVAARHGTEDQQRAVKGALLATAAPVPADPGIPTRSHQYLHVVADAKVAGTFTLRLWVRHDFGPWAIMTWFGTTGDLLVTFGTPQILEPLLLAGIGHVYPQIVTPAGGASADVWLAGSSFD